MTHTAWFRRGGFRSAVLFGALSGGRLYVPKAAAEPKPSLRSRVFGYIPYWTASKKTWDLRGLTDVALFSDGASDTGTLTSTTFWRGKDARAIIDDAHKQGIKVELAVTNFDPTSLHSLLSSTSAVDKLVAALVEESLVTQPGDGLSIDFEGLRAADRAALVSFVTKLRAAMKAKRSDSQLSLATPAVDWSKAYDYPGLAAQSDTLFIMGYGYHWSGSSTPGPGAPLSCGAPWGSICLAATVKDYVAALGDGLRHKIVLGLPLYGYDYPADSDKIGAKALGTGTAVLYSAARKQVTNRRYEPVSQTPWYVYTDAKSVIHQVFYEDEESIGKKIDFIVEQKLGGVGFWALGYEDDSLWMVVKDKLVVTDPPPPLPPPPPVVDPPMNPETGSVAEAQGCALSSRSSHMPTFPALLGVGSATIFLLGKRRRRTVRYNRPARAV